MKEKRFAESNLPEYIQTVADKMNTCEAEVPPYQVLPLISDRQEILETFAANVYGEIPPACPFETVVKNEAVVFGGIGIRKEIDLIFRNNGIERTLHMLLYIPAKRQGKVPCFFGLNFLGNIDTTNDTGVTFYPFERYKAEFVWHADRRVEAGAYGGKAYRWDFEKVLKAGFATATICCFDCFPDHPDGFDESILPLFYSREDWDAHIRRCPGAISAWAWGYLRAVDCLISQPEIDGGKIIAHGLSRLGKTALWAGANDERIALTVSICSGCCGAKMTRRHYGEDLGWLLFWRKYWFVPPLFDYIERDTIVPWDQHQLMAAIAPRKLYVASAELDEYADPLGEFTAAKFASKAWNSTLQTADFPAPGNGAGDDDVRYFIRSGGHDFTPENWDDLLSFAGKIFLND
ncbi:MAG: hypothetical protein J6R86_05110 [Lentisphaeria bacterium]|nr:hypothetical protein [Lentisphaeria bacterium]